MNIFAVFHGRIINAVKQLGLTAKDGGALDISRITVEPPRDPAHGDLATNAALVLGKNAGENPRALAERIRTALAGDGDISDVAVAGPGFINLRLSDAFWQARLAEIADAGVRYGASAMGKGVSINVEYVSANPTGPLHVGHCRGAIVGDTLANLLAFTGYHVIKEYYINDAGAQIDALGNSVLLRYREALGQDIGEIPEGLYPGDYLKPLGKALADAHGDRLLKMKPDEALKTVKDFAIGAMMDVIRQDLAALNVHQQVFASERSLHADGGRKIRNAINDLTMKGHVYKGKLPPPKGKPPEDWEDREQSLFRTTAMGDDMDRPLVKSDGSYTYFAADVGYFVDKYERGFDEMIYILGADHGGYVKRLEAVAHAVSDGKKALTVVLCQLVKLLKGGEPVKMSKRAGQFITLREVVDEVGRDAVRFMMLYRKSSEPLDFDFDKVTEQSRDNPVFYVQYAAARCNSVFRQAEQQLPGIKADTGALTQLSNASEIALVRKLAEYPRVIEAAALAREPHRIAFYLYDVASAFHAHWNKGAGEEALRFVKVNNPELTSARLALVQGVLNVLHSGLAILGVEAPQEMR